MRRSNAPPAAVVFLIRARRTTQFSALFPPRNARRRSPLNGPRPRRSPERPPEDRDRPRRDVIHKKSSTGLVVGLVVGGLVLALLFGMGLGGYVYWSSKKRAAAEPEWVTFTPPDSRFTISMPGVPVATPHERANGGRRAEIHVPQQQDGKRFSPSHGSGTSPENLRTI